MAQKSQQTGLRLHGDPHRLALTAPALTGHKTVTVELPPDLKQHTGLGEMRAEVRQRFGEQGHIRLRLPRNTPPGHYRAQVKSGEETFPLDIEVAPYRRLKVSPADLRFVGAPGSDVTLSITLANAGNVVIDIPERSHLGVYDDDGIETAFASAYRDDVEEPMDMVRTFIGKLKEGHGGLLKLRLDGAGKLEPGEQRTLRVTAHLQDKLKPGHAYHGVWTLGDLNYAVFVEVAKDKRGD